MTTRREALTSAIARLRDVLAQPEKMLAATRRFNVLSSVSNWLGKQFKSGPGTKVWIARE